MLPGALEPRPFDVEVIGAELDGLPRCRAIAVARASSCLLPVPALLESEGSIVRLDVAPALFELDVQPSDEPIEVGYMSRPLPLRVVDRAGRLSLRDRARPTLNECEQTLLVETPKLPRASEPERVPQLPNFTGRRDERRHGAHLQALEPRWH